MPIPVALAMLLAGDAPVSTASDHGALYAAVSAVLVAMIGGTVAVITSTRRPAAPAEPSPVRYIDEPTSHALVQSLTDLLADSVTREQESREAAEMWEKRARKLGWKEGGR